MIAYTPGVGPTRTWSLREALARAAAAGEPIRQDEATAIFLEALRCADQAQATLSAAGTVVHEDGSLEVLLDQGPAAERCRPDDPFGAISGAYELAGELFRGAAPLALGGLDDAATGPFATVRDLLCSLEFQLLVASRRGGPPPPARSDSRRAVLRLLGAVQGAGQHRDRPPPAARRDLIRTFEQAESAAKAATDGPQPPPFEAGREHRASARSPVEWTLTSPELPPPSAATVLPPTPAAAPALAPAEAVPAPAPASDAAVLAPLAVATPDPPFARGAPPPARRRVAPGLALGLALIGAASIAGAVAVYASRSAPAGRAVRHPAAPRPDPVELAHPTPERAAGSPGQDVARAQGLSGAARAVATSGPAPREAPPATAPAPGPTPETPEPQATAAASPPVKPPVDPAAALRARKKLKLGEDLLESGRIFQALVAFREADQAQPLPESARRLGDIYRLQHDDALAAASYRRCLRLSPSPSEAREVRAILAELRRAAATSE